MSNIRLAARYAKSLLDLAIEKNEVEKVFSDMQWLQSLCNGNRDFVNMLRNPVIKTVAKSKIIKEITAGNTGQMVDDFIQLLIHKGRENALPEITKTFIQQYKEYKGIYPVKLITALPLGEELKNKIIQQIKAVSKMKNIELEAVVNPDIIGGFVLQSGDKLVDASVSNHLKEIARQFQKNDFF
jgi:F-type H+-transporting ATPase subunit delta